MLGGWRLEYFIHIPQIRFYYVIILYMKNFSSIRSLSAISQEISTAQLIVKEKEKLLDF